MSASYRPDLSLLAASAALEDLGADSDAAL